MGGGAGGPAGRPGAAAPARPAIEVENLRVGFVSGAENNLFKVGAWTPVWVQLRAGDERFAGVMEVAVPDDDGTPTAIRQVVEVGARERAVHRVRPRRDDRARAHDPALRPAGPPAGRGDRLVAGPDRRDRPGRDPAADAGPAARGRGDPGPARLRRGQEQAGPGGPGRAARLRAGRGDARPLVWLRRGAGRRGRHQRPRRPGRAAAARPGAGGVGPPGRAPRRRRRRPVAGGARQRARADPAGRAHRHGAGRRPGGPGRLGRGLEADHPRRGAGELRHEARGGRGAGRQGAARRRGRRPAGRPRGVRVRPCDGRRLRRRPAAVLRLARPGAVLEQGARPSPPAGGQRRAARGRREAGADLPVGHHRPGEPAPPGAGAVRHGQAGLVRLGRLLHLPLHLADRAGRLPVPQARPEADGADLGHLPRDRGDGQPAGVCGGVFHQGARPPGQQGGRGGRRPAGGPGAGEQLLRRVQPPEPRL